MKQKRKTPVRTNYCPICHKRVTRGGPALHFHEEHKEYLWHREGQGYYCDFPLLGGEVCGRSFAGFGTGKDSLVTHYATMHGVKVPALKLGSNYTTPNRTLHCPICGERCTRTRNGGGPGQHYHENHKEFQWHRETKNGHHQYHCDLLGCGAPFSSFGAGKGSLLLHYQVEHKEVIAHLKIRAADSEPTPQPPAPSQRVENEVKRPSHIPPARLRYEESHPTISCRLSKDEYDLLKQRLGDLSFADFVKDSLGLLQLKTLSRPDSKAIDKLLDQVAINTNLLKEEQEEKRALAKTLEEEQKKNAELTEKCIEYATRIVELQNKMAEDTRRRY